MWDLIGPVFGVHDPEREEVCPVEVVGVSALVVGEQRVAGEDQH